MRWKALRFLGKLEDSEIETFGFSTTYCPSPVEDLIPFENDLMKMIKDIEFRKVNDSFLNAMSEDIKNINNMNHLLISADKSSNIYKFDKDDYSKHLQNNVTKTYKKSNQNTVNTVNLEAKKIAENLSITNRVEKMLENEAFITVKDHKEGFPHRLSFRLLNPSKSNMGKISKCILDKINSAIISQTKVNQWKNSKSVINWYDNLPEKHNSSFICFDVENFYPSISKQLFDNTINFAKQCINIPH